MAREGSSGLLLVAACLGLWSCRDFAGHLRPVPGLVSWAGTSVVDRGWADAGLPLDSPVDGRQLAPLTALTMYPSLAVDPWPGTIPTAYLVSGMIALHHWGAPVKKGWCGGQCVELLLCAQASESDSLGLDLVSA